MNMIGARLCFGTPSSLRITIGTPLWCRRPVDIATDTSVFRLPARPCGRRSRLGLWSQSLSRLRRQVTPPARQSGATSLPPAICGQCFGKLR